VMDFSKCGIFGTHNRKFDFSKLRKFASNFTNCGFFKISENCKPILKDFSKSNIIGKHKQIIVILKNSLFWKIEHKKEFFKISEIWRDENKKGILKNGINTTIRKIQFWKITKKQKHTNKTEF